MRVGDGLLRSVSARLLAAAEGTFLTRNRRRRIHADLDRRPASGDGGGAGRRLHAAVADDLDVNGQICAPASSVGIAIYPTDGADEMTLIANADAALYRPRRRGAAGRDFSTWTWTSGCVSGAPAARIALGPGPPRIRPPLSAAGADEWRVRRGWKLSFRWHNPACGMVSPA